MLTKILHNALVSSSDKTPAAFEAQTQARARGKGENLGTDREINRSIDKHFIYLQSEIGELKRKR